MREGWRARISESRALEDAMMDSSVSSTPFVAGVGAWGTASSMLNFSSGWPVICGLDTLAVVLGVVVWLVMLDMKRVEGLDALRAALRPEGC